MDKKEIAQILKDNITFSGQLGDYVIHGAIDKIIELHKSLIENERERIQHCQCKPEETTGTTKINCCNICGHATDKFWQRGPEEVKIQATSFTTGEKKWFTLTESQYNKRFTDYPAWSFDENTKLITNKGE